MDLLDSLKIGRLGESPVNLSMFSQVQDRGAQGVAPKGSRGASPAESIGFGEFPFETGTGHDWGSKMLQRCGSRINRRVGIAGRAAWFDRIF